MSKIKFEYGAEGEILGAEIEEDALRQPRNPPKLNSLKAGGVGPIRRLVNVFRVIVDRADVDDQRLRAIEDRLARLDGGHDAKRARPAAYDAVASRRLTNKESKPLSIPRLGGK